jgi:hypothetical protein
MGEVKRRRLAAAEQLIANFQYIDNEAAGVWSIDIINLIPGSALTDLLPQATSKKQLIAKIEILTQGMIDLQSQLATRLCLLCTRSLAENKIAAFVLALAEVDKPTGGVLNAVCTHCAADTDVLLGRVKQYYKDHLFGPNVRFLTTPLSAPSRA